MVCTDETNINPHVLWAFGVDNFYNQINNFVYDFWVVDAKTRTGGMGEEAEEEGESTLTYGHCATASHFFALNANACKNGEASMDHSGAMVVTGGNEKHPPEVEM